MTAMDLNYAARSNVPARGGAPRTQCLQTTRRCYGGASTSFDPTMLPLQAQARVALLSDVDHLRTSRPPSNSIDL